MNNHRLFFSLILSFLIIYLTSSSECDEHSNKDDIPFDTRVLQSPIVLIGISLNKNFDINIPNLFNVTLLVECILKGRPTQRIIHIVQAGLLLGRRSCQSLNVNRQYIVFLEPFFDGTYRPVDFEEVPYTNQIDVLLENTCGLSRIYPFTESNDTDAALTNKCPIAVSNDCQLEIPKTTVAISTTSTVLPSTTTSGVMFVKDTIDLAALSILLAEHQRQNLSLAFLQSQNHKSLFSDDEARKNGANQFSIVISATLILFYFVHFFL